MAFFNNSENNNSGQGMNNVLDDEKEKKEQLSNGSPISLTSGPVNNTSTGQPTQNNKPASSGMAPGFQSYVKANQGLAQDRLTNQAASTVEKAGSLANKAINQATNQFQQQVETGSLANRNTALNDVKSTVQAARSISVPDAHAPAAKPVVQQTAPLSGYGRDNEPVVSTKNQPIAPKQAPVLQTKQAAPVPQALTDEQKNRFAEVINAQYKGPESLRQSGLYNLASGNVQNAQKLASTAQTAAGREEMLKQMFQQRGDYSAGLNKLDTAMLNSSQAGVSNLQNIAKNYENVGANLESAQTNSSNMAQNRAREIADIQSQARNEFSSNKTAQELATEERIAREMGYGDALKNQLMSSWNASSTPEAKAAAIANLKKVNNYDAIKNASPSYNTATQYAQLKALDAQIKAIQNGNSKGLTSEELNLLGLSNGQRVYDSGIKTQQLEKDRLVSQNEQARLAALSMLAGLDKTNALDSNLLYSDVKKAGTQTARDVIDTNATSMAIKGKDDAFKKENANTFSKMMTSIAPNPLSTRSTINKTASAINNQYNPFLNSSFAGNSVAAVKDTARSSALQKLLADIAKSKG